MEWRWGSWVAVLAAIAGIVPFMMPGADLRSLRGKRILVCGGSEGIGRSMALTFARFGAQVVITSRSKDKLDKVAETARNAPCAHEDGCQDDPVLAVSGDLSNLEHRIGGIDMLVLNHIRPFFGAFEETPLSTVKSIVEVNLLSYLYLTHLSLPMLHESGGSLLVMSSVAGKMGIPYVVPYSATKHGLHGFVDSLRLELDLQRQKSGSGSKPGVSITAAVIGNIDTESAKRITEGHLANLRRASPDDCAVAVIQGTLDKKREVYFPFLETSPGIFLVNFFPELIGWMVKATVG